MKAFIGFCALALSLGTMANAQTVNTVLNLVNATVTLSATAVTATGPVTLTNIGSGTFNGTLPFSGISGANVVGSYTITLPGGTITGALTLPETLFSNLLSGSVSSGAGSGTITGGTGSYTAATGSFPNLTGSGTANATTGVITVTITGAGSITTGVTSVPPFSNPTVTAVLDGAGNTANIAEGGIFIVKGTNLSASGVAGPFNLPYPTSSGGVQIAFTPIPVGPPTTAYLVYLYNQSGTNQLAAILPSTLAAGAYNLTVTNNNNLVSAPFLVTVLQHKPGLFTQDTSGTGLAVVQNFISVTEYDINRFTTGTANATPISPAKPGQTLIAWATGLGPITTGDNTAPPFLNFLPSLNVQAIVGGVSITPTFAGRSGYPGEDQINFTLPSNIPTGCTVSFQISVNGVLSNPTFLSIAPGTSASSCTAPGLTTAQLQNLDQGGTLTQAGFNLVQFSTTATLPTLGTVTEKIDSLGGSFTQFTGFQLAAATALTSLSGACQIIPQATSQSVPVFLAGGTNLDAGAIALTGPSGSNLTNQALTEDPKDNYSLAIGIESAGLPPGVTIPGLTNASIVPGTYSLKGAGGKDVGPFNASVNLGTALTIAGGLPTSVTRSAGLTLNWTGGNSTDLVEIIGSAGTTGNTTTFICSTTAGATTLTVPASILQQLPAETAVAITAGTATGSLAVLSSPSPASGNGLFTAPLTAGGSIANGTFFALIGVAGTPAYQ
jgi:uncharacterized protein (TIGR03437 family)